MTKRNRERSLRIVTEATRIIELTARIDETLEQAKALTEDRYAAAIELTRLASTDIEARSLRLNRVATSTALGMVTRSGEEGIQADKLIQDVAELIGFELTEAEMQAGMMPFLSAGEIHLRAGTYRPIKGKSNRRHGKRLLGLPTDREMIIKILEASAGPLGVAEIVESIRTQFGETIPRTTVSPLLAKLRDKGIVVHLGDKWMLPKA